MKPMPRLRGRHRRADLPAMLAALDEAVEALDGRAAPALLDRARAVSTRAGERLRLSGEHTVVALAGSTGSGKSSLFNVLSGADISPAGVRRPTTAKAYASVWGSDGAAPLVQWLGVPAAADHLAARSRPARGGGRRARRAGAARPARPRLGRRRAPARGGPAGRAGGPAGLGRRPAEVRRRGRCTSATCAGSPATSR